MMSQATVELITQLLLAGESFRAVAARTGVSRGSVSRVFHGYRGPGQELVGQSKDFAGYKTGVGFLQDEHRVCPGCGHRVPAPCVACAAKRHLVAEGRAA